MKMISYWAFAKSLDIEERCRKRDRLTFEITSVDSARASYRQRGQPGRKHDQHKESPANTYRFLGRPALNGSVSCCVLKIILRSLHLVTEASRS